MRTKGTDRGGASRIAATAKAFGTAIVSLTLGVALCLCLLLGGTALAGGAASPTQDRGDHPALVATAASEHSLEGVSIVLEKMTERTTEPRVREERISMRPMDARRAVIWQGPPPPSVKAGHRGPSSASRPRSRR